MPSTHNSTKPFVFASVLTVAGLVISTQLLLSSREADPQIVYPGAPAGTETAQDQMQLDGISAERSSAMAAEAERGAGFYQLPLGRQFEMTYGIDGRSEVHFLDDSGVARLAMAYEGRVEVLVVAKSENEIVLRMRTDENTIVASTQDGPLSPALTADHAKGLEEPSWACIDGFGNVLGYRFGESTDVQMRNIHRTIWTAVLAEFDNEDLNAPEWSARRDDASGPFDVTYRWESQPLPEAPGELTFLKTSQDTENEEGVMEVLKSEGSATVDAGVTWLTESRYTETLRLEVASADTRVDVTTEIWHALHATTLEDVSAIPFDWDAPWDPASGARDADENVPFVSSGALRLTELGVEGLTMRIEELVQAGEHSSFDLAEAQAALKHLLMQDAAAVEALSDLIAAGTLSDTAEMVLLAAAGMAATPAAQNLLATTVEDVQASVERRRAATWSMMQLEAPNGAVVASLTNTLDGQDVSPRMRSASLLTVGAVSGRAAGETKESLLDVLLAEENKALLEGRLRTWLNAVGNAGLPELLPNIKPYFTHPDASLRATACSAVRKLTGPDATELLCRALKTDAEEQVRAAAARYCSPRATENVTITLRQVLQTEPSRSVLAQVVGGLGERETLDPDAELLLRNFANTTADTDLRAQALEILNR